MQITLTNKEPQSNLTVLPLFIGEQPNKNQNLPALALADFHNRLGSTHLIYSNTHRILLLGLGEKKQFNQGSWRVAIHSVVNASINLKIESLNLWFPKISNSLSESFFELTGFALIFSSYRFDQYKKEKNGLTLKQVNLIGPVSNKFNKAIDRGVIIGQASNSSRDLANHPGNIATPTHLAQHALASAKKYGFSCKILGPKEIAKEKMGLLMGVSQGSEQPAQFIVLEAGPKSKPPIVIIGKGLTFDSGGISIKPSDRLEEMKYDMCGGATVLGIFEAISQLKLPIHVVGLIPSAENLLSGKAVKPGDILTAHDQTSVEIINTDAEGRLVLADAISFAKKYYKPKLIMDHATLTGAVVSALGDEYAGFFTNTPTFTKQLKQSAKNTAEKIWELPLAPEYKEQLKSAIADIKNLGEKGSAGASTAALFLSHFVGETPWIHLDTAGTAWTMRPKSQFSVGATGWGVYLTVEFLKNIK